MKLRTALAFVMVGACAGVACVSARDLTVETGATLQVPIVRQAPEHCGQAVLEMVLRFYGAGEAALREGDGAYDPVLRGSLITDLAAAARRAGFAARIATLDSDSLVAELHAGRPPIVLYQVGRAPLTRPHFAVVAGWDPGRQVFILNDGGAAARAMRVAEFSGRWRTAGSLALLVARRTP